MPFAKAVGYLLGRSSHESGQRNDRDTAREKYESVCTRPKMLKVERDERVQRPNALAPLSLLLIGVPPSERPAL